MKSQTSLMAYIQDLLGEDFNIALFFSIVRKSLIWILLLVLIGLTSVWLYLRYTLPNYQATSTLMLKREQTAQQTMREQLLGPENNVLGSSVEEASREIQLVKSKYFIQRVIKGLPFDVSYFREGRTKFVSSEVYTATPFKVNVLEIKSPDVYGQDIYVELLNDKSFILRYKLQEQDYREILSYDNFFETPFFEIRISLSALAKANLKEHIGKVYFFRINDIERYSEYLSQRITVVPLDPSTKTISISYQDKNRSKASDLVNALSKEFVQYDIERQSESAQQILSFLESEIDSFSDDLREYSDSLKQFRLDKSFLDPEQEMQSLTSNLRGLEQQKLQYLLEIKLINWFSNYMSNLTDIESVSVGLLGTELGVVSQYVANIKGMERDKEELLMNVSPNHPGVKLIDENIIRTKNEMSMDLDNVLIQKNYRLESIDEQYYKYLGRLLVLPEEQAEYARLKSAYESMANYYQLLVDKQTDYKVAKAGMVSDYMVLSTAMPPQEPIGPKSSFLWTLAASAALLLGLILIVVRYMLHNTIISVETIQKNTKASMLGIVPTVFTDIPLSGIVVTQNPKSIITEAFRVIRNNLQFISNTPGPKTLAITSTISGEGKTFTSINLGAILSLLDKRVIILDVDMRRPRLSKIFNVDNTGGMSTILIGRDKVDECIRKTELKNFDFITSGPIPPNPAELILSERLNEMVDYLKTKYDYIIFDTPPLGLVTDGFEVIKNVDYPIYVFRAEYSSKSFISNLDKLINENKVMNLSVVLNDVGRGVSGYSYGSYNYKYGYSYGYLYTYKDSGYYTDETIMKKSFLKKLFKKS
ncbi:MAG: polysaccharide biosynthesis tyrosine autokinase [Chitinophagales bacterium]|nr:polysaccharide biosynthesis tyrosine autokinase [Chitinophagales bacterium]